VSMFCVRLMQLEEEAKRWHQYIQVVWLLKFWEHVLNIPYLCSAQRSNLRIKYGKTAWRKD
jgi:hypothetical protein